MTSRLIVTQTNGHITMHWSANVGTTSKTASTVYGILCLHCKGKRLAITFNASRAQILDKATEYIQYMRRKNHTHQQDIDDLKRQNALLEQQVRALEKAKGHTQLQASYSSSDSSLYTNPKGSAVSAFDGGSDSSSESEPEEPPNRKKLRLEAS
ncbi:protein max-like isoform X4 [Conger conger]|uniref:protein max-like isoform X4 n=1 Tax=Conger conger TaxID=82655 RepID=UPI002A59C171|nr:protein max-like isoform X4 [Conger conger]